MPPTMIRETAELEALCVRARALGWIALDTEFLWERTYAPVLCLAQIAVGDERAIADPLDGVDLKPLAALIGDPAVEKILHAPQADLVAFVLHFDIEPCNVFDTQLAAGFVGYSAGMGYERLVKAVTGAKAGHTEGYSDWSRRPLDPKQLAYAIDDVEYLPELTRRLKERLHALGRHEWARTEIDRRFCDVGRLVTAPEEAWRKVGRRSKLDATGIGVLRAVAAWRERTARMRDQPTGWVMKDPTLVEIARRRPKTINDLTRIRGVDLPAKSRQAHDLLQEVRDAEPIHISGGKAPDARTAEWATLARGIAGSFLRARCAQTEIAPELVGTSADIESLASWAVHRNLTSSDTARDDTDADAFIPRMAQGWRADIVGNDLIELFEGRIAVRLLPTSPYIQVFDAIPEEAEV